MYLKDFADILGETVIPQTYPLAVKMTSFGEALPEKTRKPLRDLKNRLAICQCFSMARKYGWVMALGREDQSCPIGSIVLGFEEAVPYYTEGNLAEGMYTCCKESGARSEEALGRFKQGEYEYLLMAPITKAEFDPDFVLVYCNPAQLMRLVHAALYEEGGSITSSFTGRGECSQTIVHTISRERCQVLLPGNGERVFGQTQDHEMAFSIPRAKIASVAQGLAKTHKAGVRYPIPAMLNYPATYPKKYTKLFEIWEK